MLRINCLNFVVFDVVRGGSREAGVEGPFPQKQSEQSPWILTSSNIVGRLLATQAPRVGSDLPDSRFALDNTAESKVIV